MFLYETHLHTKLTSACSHFEPQEVVEKFIRLGYAGVFVSDHFLNGNTTVSRTLPWKKQITLFCDGYRAVKKCAEGTGLQVFFSFEYSYKGTDFLVYGIGEDWLKAHPEIMEKSVTEVCPYLRKAGALVIQAHPYREANYIDHIRLFPSVVDGLETMNACRDERTNRLADVLANEYNLIKTAGSDIHAAEQVFLAGMKFHTRLKDEMDFIRRLKAREGELFTLKDEQK